MKPTPPGWPRITPSLIYDDANKAIEWLGKAFGFAVRLKVEDEKGGVAHSELTFGDGVIMVSSSKDAGARGVYKSPKSFGGALAHSLMVYVDDIEAHHARAVAAGAKITAPVEMHDYGEEYWADRSYGATDLEGHGWWFSQRVRG
jgi:uncharacterized glyoxalase superfamily protein PhnB